MTTKTTILYKSIQVQKFLNPTENARAQTQHPYTHMILPPGQGHNVVQELSRGVTGKVADQFRKKAKIDESAFRSIIGY